MKAKRKKITVMMPEDLIRKVDVAGRSIGCGRNGFIALACSYLIQRTHVMGELRSATRSQWTNYFEDILTEQMQCSRESLK